MSEHQHIEWKSSWRDEYLKWICGFANADGGVLVIGRNDAGTAVGVPDARRLLDEIPNKVRDILGIMVDVNLRQDDGKDLLEIVVDAYPYPVSYKGEYHYRSGSTKQELKGAALDHFLLRKQGRHWDGAPVPQVAVRNLSATVINGFRARARDSKRLPLAALREPAAGLIERLRLLEGQYLRRAAVLLFHPDPERFVTGAFVKIGYFRGESNLIYHDEIHGALFSQVEQVMELLLTKYMRAAISYRGIQRVESFPVPEEALRESLLNALIHRDYAVPAPIQIRVYDDRLNIWNPAVLPQGWSLEKLLGEHASLPFNPLVANAFFRAGEIEAWGRGIHRIFQSCRDSGTPEPRVHYQPNELRIEFPFSATYLNAVSIPAAAADRITPESHEQWGEEWGKRWGEKWGETWGLQTATTRIRIAEAMHANPRVATASLAATLGMTTSGVEKHLKAMREAGAIRRVGPARGGHWEVVR